MGKDKNNSPKLNFIHPHTQILLINRDITNTQLKVAKVYIPDNKK